MFFVAQLKFSGGKLNYPPHRNFARIFPFIRDVLRVFFYKFIELSGPDRWLYSGKQPNCRIWSSCSNQVAAPQARLGDGIATQVIRKKMSFVTPKFVCMAHFQLCQKNCNVQLRGFWGEARNVGAFFLWGVVSGLPNFLFDISVANNPPSARNMSNAADQTNLIANCFLN